MASQGPLSPGTLADDASVGSIAWSNPGNAAASDDSRATLTLTLGATGHYLKATNFGFSIPSGATINGIVVGIEKSRQAVGDTPRDNIVAIVKGGTIGSTNYGTSTTWPSADSYISYGTGTTDLWGETWTDSDINGSGFGAVVSPKDRVAGSAGTARVDHIRITVYYTGSAGTLAVTLDALTSSSAGTEKITGGAAGTLASLTLNSAGTVVITGSLAATLGALTASSAGSEAVSGGAAVTLAALTLTSAGSVVIAGALAGTLDALTAAGTGGEIVGGAAAGTLDDVTLSATGSLRIAGALGVTLEDAALSASGVNGWAIAGVTRDCLTSAPLPGCTVMSFRTGDMVMDGTAVSDGSGNYSLLAGSAGPHFLVAYRAGSPDLAGTTRNDIVGV